MKDSGDLLYHLPVHADARDGESYGGSYLPKGEGKILTHLDVFLVEAMGHIYGSQTDLNEKKQDEKKQED